MVGFWAEFGMAMDCKATLIASSSHHTQRDSLKECHICIYTYVCVLCPSSGQVCSLSYQEGNTKSRFETKDYVWFLWLSLLEPHQFWLSETEDCLFCPTSLWMKSSCLYCFNWLLKWKKNWSHRYKHASFTHLTGHKLSRMFIICRTWLRLSLRSIHQSHVDILQSSVICGTHVCVTMWFQVDLYC